MRREAAYLRVSTAKQDETLQREAIERAAAARGAPIAEWFADGASRDRYDRPQLSSLREMARRGRVATVWVWRLDRLGSGALQLLTVVKELQGQGVRVMSVTESFDTSSPFADAILAVIGAMAQSELEAIRERTAEARARAERDGKHWGRPPSTSPEQLEILTSALGQGLTLRKSAKLAGLSYSVAQRIATKRSQEDSAPENDPKPD